MAVGYMSIWAAPQQRPKRAAARPQGDVLRGRVKDWPKAAQDEYKRVKDQLWKWAKKENIPYKGGLGLIAYEAVKQVWENPDPTTIYIDDMEDMKWETISKLCE